MTVTIFGATNLAGNQLIIHAMAKGWKVKAFGRNVDSLIDKDLHIDDFTAIKGYVFDAGEVRHAIEGSDAILSVLGANSMGSEKSRSLGMKNIIAQMKEVGINRIVALSNYGILPGRHANLLMNEADFPPELISISAEHKQAYDYLKESGLDWTLACPASLVDGSADNDFEIAAEAATPGPAVSYGNLALFMVEELERGDFMKQRVGICNTEEHIDSE